jgi:Ni/Co efflux regulator RcnB
MRKLLALLLLAGTAAPALAAGDDHPWRHRESGTQSAPEDRGSRPTAHVERGDRGGNDTYRPQPSHVEATHVISSGGGNSGEHRSNFEFRGRSGGSDPQPVTPVESNGGNGSQAREPRFHHGFVSRASSGDQSADQPARHDTLRGTIGNVRSDDSTASHGPRIIEAPQDRSVSDLREQRRSVPAVFRNRVPIVSNTPHEGTQPPRRIESRRSHNWVDWSTSHWRNDRKYDWKDHRRRHRSLFHLGFYYDPFGWGYRPYQIGWRLWPSYYSSNFWLNDPWQYRLPYAPPGYRWIRYYDDALLVDTWDGRVVDVIYNFFW